MWGLRGREASVIIRIGDTLEHLRTRCPDAALAGRFEAPFIMPYESGREIFVCHSPQPTLAELWPRMKSFQ
jgi:hypothetical protein